jgi:hypothetical protein
MILKLVKKHLVLVILFLCSSAAIQANLSVRSHAELIKGYLTQNEIESARFLLADSNTESIQIFNEAFMPFFQLFIESEPEKASISLKSFNEKYGSLVDLKDYNDHYEAMRETFFNVEAHPQVNAQELYTQPLPGPSQPMVLAEIDLLMALGASKQITRKSEEQLGQPIIRNASEEIIRTEKKPESLENPDAVKISIKPKQNQVTVEDPAEVKPVEVAEETPEQSSQWWLWLVGALVVLGGLVVLGRRKS